MKVSILIPAYNTGRYIQKAILSAVSQSYKDTEVVVIDDGSEDDTYERALELASPKADIVYLRHEKNRGLPAALRTGIDMSSGEVLTFLGSDDTLTKDSVTKVAWKFRDNKDLGYVWTNFRYQTGRVGWSSVTPNGVPLWNAICECRWWRACCQQFWSRAAYRASRGLDDAFPYAADLQLAVRLAETGCDTEFIPYVTYIYTSPRAGSISTGKRLDQGTCARQIIADSVNYMRGKR